MPDTAKADHQLETLFPGTPLGALGYRHVEFCVRGFIALKSFELTLLVYPTIIVCKEPPREPLGARGVQEIVGI